MPNSRILITVLMIISLTLTPSVAAEEIGEGQFSGNASNDRFETNTDGWFLFEGEAVGLDSRGNGYECPQWYQSTEEFCYVTDFIDIDYGSYDFTTIDLERDTDGASNSDYALDISGKNRMYNALTETDDHDWFSIQVEAGDKVQFTFNQFTEGKYDRSEKFSHIAPGSSEESSSLDLQSGSVFSISIENAGVFKFQFYCTNCESNYDYNGEKIYYVFDIEIDQSSRDSDGDGEPDSSDSFPNDASETADSDNDGVGDNADAFPNDASETVDSDNDGVGDNADAFPNDASETADSDMDGVGDNADAFPNDPEKSVLENEKESEDTPSLSLILTLASVLLAGLIYTRKE